MNTYITRPCLLLAFFLSGCGGAGGLDRALGIGPSINTGQIDYRVAEPFPITKQRLENHNSDQPLAPAKLKRRFSLPSEAFDPTKTNETEKEVYSIVLEQAVLGEWISEVKLAYPAEIAILANAFEFDGKNDTPATSRFYDFPEITGPAKNAAGQNTAAQEGLKLIYFSPDVYNRQPLNFSSLPIVPPSKYNGRPIGIQIVILELDRMSAPLKSLLQRLADIGQASNIAKAIPGVGDTALDLGRSLLDGNSNKDDILFEYRMVLNPKNFSSTSKDASGKINASATFQPGRHVIRRIETRNVQMPWAKLRLDHNTSRLFREADSGFIEHREDTYLVVNIQKHLAGTPEAQYAFRTLANLNADLEEAVKTDGSASLKAITDSIDKRVIATRSNAWLDSVSGKWNNLKEEALSYDLYRFPIVPPSAGTKLKMVAGAPCSPRSQTVLKPDRIAARLKVTRAANAFVAEYNRALVEKRDNPNGGTRLDQFGTAERATLVSIMGLFVVPKDDSKEANFSDVSSFESIYITPQTGNELSKDIIGAMDNIEREFSCDDLENRGWKG